MGVTNPNYPTMEIALCMVNAPDNADGTERMKKGDIIAIRKPADFIGSQEGKIFLWLHIDGPEENEFAAFAQQVYEPTDPETGERFDKRRYEVPLGRLQVLYPAFNQSRATDPNDFYQPFLLIDSEDFEIVAADPAYVVSGLVFDKAIGDYL
jgi:hypothetical protein